MSEQITPQHPWETLNRGFEPSMSADHDSQSTYRDESPVENRDDHINFQDQTPAEKTLPRRANVDRRTGNVVSFPGSFGKPELSLSADHDRGQEHESNQGAA